MIQAALTKKPSSAASARMARALGVAVTGVVTSFPAKAQGADVAVPKVTTAVTGASTVVPWVSVGLLGLVIGGAVVGARARHAPAPRPTPAALSAPAHPPPVISAAIQAPGHVDEPAPAPLLAGHRSHLGAAGVDLRREIAFVDAARRAMSEGTVVGRWRSCAATATGTRPRAFAPKRQPSKSRR